MVSSLATRALRSWDMLPEKLLLSPHCPSESCRRPSPRGCRATDGNAGSRLGRVRDRRPGHGAGGEGIPASGSQGELVGCQSGDWKNATNFFPLFDA